MRLRDHKHGRPLSPAEVVAQLCLFMDLPTAPPQHGRPCRQRTNTITDTGGGGESDLEPIQRIVPAAGAAVPKTLGPCSVFAMAAAPSVGPLRLATTTSGSPAPFGRIIVREGGITRHTAVRLQDTEEWAEKERQRRARQRPPRPPRQKFKMKGSRAWAAEQQ
ncbi:hypothetical protein BH10PSE18_BH10PSE18_08170 [soil metagenome]